MSFEEKLRLVITGDAAGAIKAFEATGAAAKKELGATEDHSARMFFSRIATALASVE